MSENGGFAETDIWGAVERADRALGEFGVVTAARTVRFERVLPGPIERVWSYLTESEKRGRWFASGDMDLRVGGRGELRFHHADLSAEKIAPEKYRQYEGGQRAEVTIKQCDPPRLLTY